MWTSGYWAGEIYQVRRKGEGDRVVNMILGSVPCSVNKSKYLTRVIKDQAANSDDTFNMLATERPSSRKTLSSYTYIYIYIHRLSSK